MPTPVAEALLPWDMWALLGYQPNQWALEQVHTSTARFNAFCTCRQCGKTEAAALLIHEMATRKADAFGPPLVAALSFDYKHARLSINKWLTRMKAAGIEYRINQNDHIVYLPWNNAQVHWLSAEQDPMAVAGYTWSDVLVDEAQGVPDEVYTKLRPGLDVRRARLFAFGTPDIKPDNTWFEGLYRRGQLRDQPQYHSFTLPAYQNQWMSYETIKEAREGTTEENFRMLYLGQWVQTANKVFRAEDVDALERCKQLLAPKPGAVYVAGADFGQMHDYSVLYIMDAATKEIVWWWRQSGLKYHLVEEVVVAACQLFRVQMLMAERNGPGAPIIDHLRNAGVTVWDLHLQNLTKTDMVERLAADVQFGRIKLPAGHVQLPSEMVAYGKKMSASGSMWTYSAPEGFFDDCVIALMYAAEAARNTGTISLHSYASWGGSGLVEAGRRIA